MPRGNLQTELFPFFAGAVFTAVVFLVVGQLDRQSYVYLFFFRSWYVQAVTTWLFGAALAFVLLRFRRLREEKEILDRKIAVERLETVTREKAAALLEAIPAKYRHAMSFRRIGELLRGYLYGEEVIRLNQELSRGDVERVETGHLVLNALRQLIPVLGFHGTVVGLSLGMVQFPEISRSGVSIDSLRTVLKDFAASLSVAFDTTLLALGYSVIVVLVAAVLRHREELFVAEVDSAARQLISKLSPLPGPAAGRDGSYEELLRRWIQEVQWWLKDVAESMRHNGDAVVQKLEELKGVLRTPAS